MPEKEKKPRKSREKALADRVYRHYKALKSTCDFEWVKDYDCESCNWSTYPHMHGHQELRMPNHIWKYIARAHKIKVREVKDIVSARRQYNSEVKVHDSL